MVAPAIERGMRMEQLFSPFRIKSLELKNRIVLPPLASFLTDANGGISDATVEHYRRRAAGGPAMVIMEACAVTPEGVVSANQPRLADDAAIEGVRRIARAIKSEGAVAAFQLHHAGRQTSARVIGRKPLAPSHLPCPSIRGEVEPLEVEGIQRLVDAFASAAVRGYAAGFDLIEIHGAHGYLINQFLSPFSNVRRDAYGGDVDGRTRFAVEIVREIRKRLGPDYPISFKISAQEFVPDGLTVEACIPILQRLVSAGVDAVQVSAGNDATPEWICQPMFMGKACLADSAAAVRSALQIPTMAVGRINDPLTAERVIQSGKADLVCIGRGLIADPEMPIKAREGRLDEIRTCIACNTCMQSIFRKGRLECLVNPSLGRENEMQIIPTDTPRRLMIVGGGPGGMNTAWVAAKRGHEVHLFEKQKTLGGQLVPGSKTAYKREMQSLIRFQKKQLDLNGVTCHLGCEVTPEMVAAFTPDAVVLATGSKPILPDVEGIRSEAVVTFDAVLNGGEMQPGPVVIIGGGATGCEVAWHLSRTGCAVTIIEMTAKIGRGLEAMTKRMLLRALEAADVRILTGHTLVKIDHSGVTAADAAGKKIRLAAAQVVVAIGIKADNRLQQAVETMGYETHVIGDCLEPRDAKSALYESAVLARRL